jgi:hypothetical protein
MRCVRVALHRGVRCASKEARQQVIALLQHHTVLQALHDSRPSWEFVVARVIDMIHLEIESARKRLKLSSSGTSALKDVVPMLREMRVIADKRMSERVRE